MQPQPHSRRRPPRASAAGAAGTAYGGVVTATRRQVLAAGAMGALAALGGCTRGASPDQPSEQSGEASFHHRPGTSTAWRLALPAVSREPRPRLVVALHGRGGNASDAWSLGLHRAATDRGLALASADGGETYWHDRHDGSDTGAMVIEDLVPLLAAVAGGSSGSSSASPSASSVWPGGPIGLIGWSMGGYGALWLAARYGPRVVGAAAGMSSALWTSAGASAAGAFDNREDFLAHDVFARGPALAKVPIHLDCGTSDPFIAANRAFTAVVPHAVTTFDAGGHDDTYWSAHGIRALDWLAATLPASGSR